MIEHQREIVINQEEIKDSETLQNPYSSVIVEDHQAYIANSEDADFKGKVRKVKQFIADHQ